MLFPTNDALSLKQVGGLIAGLTQHLSIFALAHAIPAAGLTFLWGTQPLAAIMPLVAMALLIGCAYLYGLPSHIMHPLVQITPLTLGFWTLAIVYPTLIYIALGKGGIWSGHYLHSVAPALAPVIGIALVTVTGYWLGRRAFFLLLGYNVVF